MYQEFKIKPWIQCANILAVTSTLFVFVAASRAWAESANTLTLAHALEVALHSSTELKAAQLDISASEARSTQAGAIPNPSLDTDIETIPKTGETASGMDVTVLLSQPFELGGKRSKRVKVAEIERDVAGWSEKSKRLDIMNEVTKLFIDVLAGQEKVKLSEARKSLAQDVLKAATNRLAVGKGSNLDQAKARIALTTSEIEAERSARIYGAAKEKLSMSLGENAPSFSEVDGKFAIPTSPPQWTDLTPELLQNPDLKRLAKEHEQKTATLEFERSRQVPDVTLKGGIKYATEGGSIGYLAGISLPLPLFDRNQGGIREASLNVDKASQEQLTAERKARASLQDVYTTSSIARNEAEALQRSGIPEAQKAFDVARSAYDQGRLSYLEVLDAQKTFFETKAQFIESLVVCLKADADLQRLLGTSLPIPELQQKGMK